MRKAKGIKVNKVARSYVRNSGKSGMELENLVDVAANELGILKEELIGRIEKELLLPKEVVERAGIKMHVQDENLKFRVNVKVTIGDTQHEIEETEASWYLVDQQGNFYSHSPMKPITPCTKEDSLEFKLKIGEEYLTVKEIEERLGVIKV